MTQATPSPRTIADRFQLAHEGGTRGEALAELRRAYLATVKLEDRELAASAARASKALPGNTELAYHPRDLSVRTGSPVGGWYEVRRRTGTTAHYRFPKLEALGFIYPAGDGSSWVASRKGTKRDMHCLTLPDAAAWILEDD